MDQDNNQFNANTTGEDSDSQSGVISWRVSVRRPHTWHPPTDLYELDEKFIIRVEIAGMNKEEFRSKIEASLHLATKEAAALMNFLVISFNGFRMPVAENLYLDTQGEMAGYVGALSKNEIFRYTLMTPKTVFPFFGDIIYVPVFGGFASIGDVLLAVGLAFIIVRGMRSVRTQQRAFE